jgi:hypothetical protein
MHLQWLYLINSMIGDAEERQIKKEVYVLLAQSWSLTLEYKTFSSIVRVILP